MTHTFAVRRLDPTLNTSDWEAWCGLCDEVVVGPAFNGDAVERELMTHIARVHLKRDPFIVLPPRST